LDERADLSLDLALLRNWDKVSGFEPAMLDEKCTVLLLCIRDVFTGKFNQYRLRSASETVDLIRHE